MYMERNQTRIDARKSELLPRLVKEVITEASLFREIEVLTRDFTSTLESLLQVIDIYYEDEAKATDGLRELKAIEADLRGLITDLRCKASEVPDHLAHHLKYLELRRNVEESSSLWILTVIASLFLPLSLACGILSMQTRLKDLHLLLYDFCGVTVLMATLLVLLLLVVKACLMASERFKREMSSGGSLAKQVFIASSASFAFLFWDAVVVSFVVGMTKDVRIGGIILGSAVAYFAASALAIIAFFCSWKRYQRREQCRKRDQPLA
ncbi:hypothetical protein diail_3595 [Diaporthe ilicicola]|nr:hypothetical protein diail_3595 [Diaporthe ilicicola]